MQDRTIASLHGGDEFVHRRVPVQQPFGHVQVLDQLPHDVRGVHTPAARHIDAEDQVRRRRSQVVERRVLVAQEQLAGHVAGQIV
jgi:hypothetical protein